MTQIKIKMSVRKWTAKWFGRCLKSFIALVLILLLAGASYQWLATWDTERKQTAPGELIDVGGHRLHIHRQGSGSPMVVLDAGLSGAFYDWETVASAIAQFTQVCTYDRAGYGWSDPGPGPRTSQRAVEELHVLLQKSEIETPFILLAHSWAGLNARLYASQYPDEILGLVLVDALNTDLDPDEVIGGQVSTEFKFLDLTAIFGTPRFAVPKYVNEPLGDPAAIEFRRAMLSRTKSAHAIYGELTGQSNWLSVRSAITPLGDKPVVVISRRIEEADCVGDAGAGNRYWLKGQEALEKVSKNTKRIIASTKDHNIQFTEPDLIVDAVREMVQAVRAKQRGTP